MNYGIFVLGATIRISLFLRLCNCVVLATSTSTTISNNAASYPIPPAFSHENIPADLELQKHFQNLMENYDHSIWNWVIGRKNYVMENYVKHAIQEEKLQNYILAEMNYENHGIDYDNSWIRSKNIDKIDHQNQRQKSADAQAEAESRFCSSEFVPVISNGFHGDSLKDPFAPTIAPGAPPGCYFIDGDGQYPKYLACDNITNIPAVLPSELDLFELNFTQIQTIPKASFSDNSISVLRLNNNPNLKSIAPSAFEGINNTKFIEIRSSPGLNWIWFEDAFAGLNKTIMLYLEFNGINLETMATGKFCREKQNIDEIQTVLPKLITLSLRQNPLTYIPRTFFAPLRESLLTLLILRNCDLVDIHQEALTFLTKLKQLDLSENPKLMTNLPNVLLGLRNNSLTALNLASNVLKEVPKTALTHIGHSLQELDLRGNPLFTLTKDAFPLNLEGMKSINFENCKLSSVAEGTFDGMPELEILMFKNNELRVLPAAIPKLHNLNILDLSFNSIEQIRPPPFEIPEGSFENLGKLKILILSNTRLKELKASTFNGLAKLNMLLLGNTELETIEDQSFSELKKLTVLDLTDNSKLAALNENTFFGLGALKTLYLNNTGIVYPPKFNGAGAEETPRLFKNTPILEYLYIANNQISSLNPQLFQGLANLHYLDINQNRLSSWNVPAFETNIVLQELRLQQNNIKLITDSMLEDFRDKRNASWYYKNIDLSFNPFNCDIGTCQLKNATEDREFELKFFEVEGYYMCDFGNEELSIPDLTYEFCDGFLSSNPGWSSSTTEKAENGKDMGDSGSGPLSSAGAKVALTLGSIGLAVILLSILVYKNQQKLSYPWFLFKLHSSKLIGRKWKSSNLISESSFYEFDVFVSYSHFDQEFIQESLVPELEEHDSKYRVCLHERDFEVGAPITENIIDSVDRSRTILIVMSEKYLESEWCLFEMNLAYHRLVELKREANSFLLVFLEDIPGKKRPKVLNYLMKSRTYLKWPKETKEQENSKEEKAMFWKRLKNALGGNSCSNSINLDTDSQC